MFNVDHERNSTGWRSVQGYRSNGPGICRLDKQFQRMVVEALAKVQAKEEMVQPNLKSL
jgi:hypothetical protein